METTQSNHPGPTTGQEATSGIPHDGRRRSERGRSYHEAQKQQAAKDWVRDHQDIAMIAAFAFGFIMGVWMKG